MNAVKIALLGTAALAAVSVSARADDLADLKAQIEALNGRISQLESTPSIPAGYQLMSISQADAIIVPGYINEDALTTSKKANNIGILPTADVPASTNIQWSGHVRVGVVYKDHSKKGADTAADFDKDTVDIRSRAGLKVVGTTDTAVGEVGVRVALIAASNGSFAHNAGNHTVSTDGYWGWWKITPELTFGGGVDGTLANSSNAFDNRCNCAFIDTGGAFGHFGGDPSQLRLSYASGPISFAIAVEDHDNNHIIGTSKSTFGFAGEMKYSGDMIGFDVNAGYWAASSSAVDADWTVNAGANMALGDIANLGIAAGVGEDGHLLGNADRYSKASLYLGFTLSDAVAADMGVTYTNNKGNKDNVTIGGGVYYTPVSQLTIGAEASVSKTKTVATDTTAALVTVWRF